MTRKKLGDLAVKYASDKLYYHSYIPMYQALFDNILNQDIRDFLEIGIGYKDLMQPLLPEGIDFVPGSSLRMWSEFWPYTNIYGCDIREDTLVNEGRIHSFHVDQSNADDLYRLGHLCRGALDIIIDDGSHQYEHQRLTARILLPLVRSGGVYVIEDVWPDNGARLASEFNGVLWNGDLGRDDNLVIIVR